MARKYWVWIILALLTLSVNKTSLAQEDTDILDFLPAIIANVEKKPPPPPPPAEWKITNLVYCPSFRSDWTVSDGITSRESSVTNSVIFSSNTSASVSVTPGERTFSWRLRTERFPTTCGAFSGSFARTLKSGYEYEFILNPNNSGGFAIETKVTNLN